MEENFLYNHQPEGIQLFFPLLILNLITQTWKPQENILKFTKMPKMCVVNIK